MALAAIHRTVPVGDQSLLLKLVYDANRDPATPLPCVVFLSGADCPHESYMWLAARLAADARLPNLKRFATLSPMPGFRRWLAHKGD